MSAKNCLVISYHRDQEPIVVRPHAKGESHFSKKDAQRKAAALMSDGIGIRAEVVEVVLAVNP